MTPDLASLAGGPLVAAPVSVSSPFDGLWLVQDGMSLANGISNGDWVEGGMAAFSLLLDGAAALIDPIGTLIGMGLSWVLEHIWPLNEYLNALTGNAGEVLRMSQTWANISSHLTGAGGDLDRILGDLEALEGAAMDAYRTFQHDVAEHIALAGTLAGATSVALEIASTIVKIVHDLTRDVISQIAGTAISAALTTVVTLGFGAPVAIAQVAARVAALVPKVTRAITALVRSMDKLAPLLAKVDEINAAIKRVLDRIIRGSSPGGAGPGSGGPGSGAGPGAGPNGPPARIPTQQEFDDWVDTLPSRDANYGSPGAQGFQTTHAGPDEVRISGEGQTVWADGVRYDPATGGVAVEVKFVDNPGGSSIYEGTAPPFILDDAMDKFDNEIARYAAAIRDPATPLTQLDLITSTPAAQQFLAARMEQLAAEIFASTGVRLDYVVRVG